MTKNKNILEKYIPLVKFLASYLGKNCEVVLHDTSNIESSIIAIENNSISGRKIGSPLTDLSLSILKNKEYLNSDFVKNYVSITKEGRHLRSATYFIKDENKNLIGMLCLNMDLTNIINARESLNEIISDSPYQESNTKLEKNAVENLSSSSLEDLIKSVIINTISKSNIAPERMTVNEKSNLVKILNEKGVFLLKGSVSKVAKYLETSEATIYRYLK